MALVTLTINFAVGLEAATKAIYHAEQEIFTPEQSSNVYQFLNLEPEFKSLYVLYFIPPPISIFEDGLTLISRERSTKDRNQALANFVRTFANKHGWFEGWKSLAASNKEYGMHGEMMKDGTFSNMGLATLQC